MKFVPKTHTSTARIKLDIYVFIFNFKMMREGSRAKPIWRLVSKIIIDTLMNNMDTSNNMIGFRKGAIYCKSQSDLFLIHDLSPGL